MNVVLPPAVSGERFEFSSPAGRLSAYVAGQGAPLLLIHSVNAAAAAAEVRPLHEHYLATRTVFSLDLPGYGFSDRSDRDYSPRLMTDAIHAVVAQIHARCGPAPIDALAVSLSCEFLARAAAEQPAHYRSLALVSPTGFRGLQSWRNAPGSTRGKPWLFNVLRGPGAGWGGAIRYFLQRTWGSDTIDDTLWRYAVLTTQMPGAEHAPIHFLAGNLFSADIHTVFEQFHGPVWMSHGVRGDFTNYRGTVLIQPRPAWQFSTFPTGALPYFEVQGDFCAAFDRFRSA